MKRLLALISGLLLVACSGNANIQFSSQMGQCKDGITQAPYCMAMTIQNNAGGQNWINSTNFPISNLSLAVGGVNNVNYPTSQGSLYDPNNCLGGTISPGGQCTFYMQLSSESAPVGSHLPVIVTASYTINDTLFGGLSGSGNSSGSSSTTVYETPALMLSSTQGWIESYSIFGLGLPYRGESSEYTAYVAANDNYYGFLYLGGNNGIYFSNESGYVGNATKSSSTLTGAGNLTVSGTTIFATPINISTLPGIYSAGLIQESFNWATYVTSGLNTATKSNVSATNGSVFYYTTGQFVQACGPISTTTNVCATEGQLISGITSLGYSQLGATAGNVALTGLVVGTANGLFAESGTGYSPTNGWVQFIDESGNYINSNINKITADSYNNLYIADNLGNIYITGSGQGNKATKMANLGIVSPGIVAMVADLSGQNLYLGTAGSNVYACAILGGSCTQIIQGSKTSFGSANLLGLNIVTSLTNY